MSHVKTLPFVRRFLTNATREARWCRWQARYFIHPTPSPSSPETTRGIAAKHLARQVRRQLGASRCKSTSACRQGNGTLRLSKHPIHLELSRDSNSQPQHKAKHCCTVKGLEPFALAQTTHSPFVGLNPVYTTHGSRWCRWRAPGTLSTLCFAPIQQFSVRGLPVTP